MVRNSKEIYAGAITVEASYISVFVVYILILLVYIGFYCHDRAVINADITYLTQMTMNSSIKWLDLKSKVVDKQMEFEHMLEDTWDIAYKKQVKYIKEKGRSLIENQMLSCRVTDIEVDEEYSYLKQQLKCRVSVTGYMKFPLYLFGKEKLSFTESCEMFMTDAIRALWVRDAVIDEVDVNG